MRQALAGSGQRLAGHDSARRVEDEVAGGRESAADQDELGIEDVDQRSDACPEVSADPGEDLPRARVTLCSEPDQAVRVGRRPELLTRELRRRRPRDVRLEVTAPCARPLAGQPVDLDDDVTELGPAAKESTVDDRPSPATRAQREHHHRLNLTRRTEVELGVGGGVRVVLDPHGKTETIEHPRPELEVVERDVDRPQHAPRSLVDRRREAEPEGGDVVVQELLDRLVDRCEELLLRPEGRLMLPAPLDTTVAVDDSGQDLRSPEVEADDALSVQTARLPYSAR